ncbi:hypothetical protein PQR75_46185 [Paraburkholderia fungorum]|uniref:hypothetical protein n=1 Tax=Paraburkholderia fungorum TaxID=134537 RepID=UPI0038BA36D1
MTMTNIRAYFRSSLRNNLLAFSHFVQRRPALYRFAVNVTTRFPVIRYWLARRIMEGGVIVPVTPPAVGKEPMGLDAVSPEVDHVKYLFQRALNARRRD